MRQRTSKKKYERWSLVASYVSMALGIGIIPILAVLIHGIHVIEEKSTVFWWSFAALLAWCGIGTISVLLCRKKGRRLEQAAGIGVPAKITNPLFKELLDENEKNRLERLTKNEFFRSWKLMSDEQLVNDLGDSFLTLWFMKKEREVLLEFSEKEVSVTVDEEYNSGNEPPALPMDGFQNLDELYRAVTAFCKGEPEKPASF